MAVDSVVRPFRYVGGVHTHHLELVRQRVDRHLRFVSNVGFERQGATGWAFVRRIGSIRRPET